MREDILKLLYEPTSEELSLSEVSSDQQKKLYSKSGRFIIERRTVSSISTGAEISPICLRPHPRRCSFPEHSHDYVEIMYVCAGSVTHRIDGQEVRVDSGDIIILGRSAKHSIRPAEMGDVGINLIISADLFEVMTSDLRKNSSVSTRALEGFLGKEQVFRVFHTAQSVEISNLLENMICSYLVKEQTDDYLLELSVRLLLGYLCAVSEKSEDSSPTSYEEGVKRKILSYVRTSYSTATLTECARTLGLSPAYLSRWICANFSQSFKDILMNERFSVACDLLTATNTSIGEIIVFVGYENSSYFHKEFKRRFGVTPSQYRRQSRK